MGQHLCSVVSVTIVHAQSTKFIIVLLHLWEGYQKTNTQNQF